jgi:hypothetical protein
VAQAVSVSGLFRTLLPLGSPNGWLAMLRAYFDDSGTHGVRSDIVLVAGIFGTEWAIDSLDRRWKLEIDNPLCGRKERVSRYHAYDCDNSIGEFAGWKRVETDHFYHRLQTIIIESGVAGYGVAVARKDWDELVTGDIRAVLGNPEGTCIRNCFVKTLDWARTHTFDPQITFIFDNRPSSVQRDAQVCSDAFARNSEAPEIVGTAFLSSTKFRPLQAADMVAWELYRHANDILIEGMKTPKREQFDRLTRNMRFVGQIAQRSQIQHPAYRIKTNGGSLHFFRPRES